MIIGVCVLILLMAAPTLLLGDKAENIIYAGFDQL